MSFQYPPKPWNDGQTVRRDMEDGTVLIGQYDASKNLWHFFRSTGDGTSGIVTTADVYTLNERPDTGTNPFALSNDPSQIVSQQEANWWLFEHLGARLPIFSVKPPTEHPGYVPPESDLIQGDVWIDTSDAAQYVQLIWDGSGWVPLGTAGRLPIFDTDEPTEHPDYQPPGNELQPGDIWYDTTDPDELVQHIWNGTDWLKVGGDYVHRRGDTMNGPLKYKESVQITDDDMVPTKGYVDLRDKTTFDFSRRINDNVDFINNTVSGGLWVHTIRDQPAALPGPTEFFLFDEFDQNTTEFSEVRKVLFAGEGTGNISANPNLQYTRVGDNLLIQETEENDFGYYVVESVDIIGQPDLGGLWFIEMAVRVASSRALGDAPELAHCTVKVARPVFTLSSTTPPILSENGQLWYNPDTNTLSVWDQDAEEFYPIGGAEGDSSVVVGDNPPSDPYEGQLWFDTSRLELFIRYVEDQSGTEVGSWLPSSPLGARVAAGEALQAEIVTRVGNLEDAVEDGVSEQISLRSRIGDAEAALDIKIDNIGNNRVASGGGEWRIQGANKTFIKVDDSAQTVGLFNLQEASEDHHAISMGWAKNHTIQLSGDNKVTNDWKIQCGTKTHYHVKDGTTRIYYLQEPSHAQHPVTLQYADNNYAGKSSVKGSYHIFNCNGTANSTYATEAIYWTTDGDKVKLVVSCDAMDDFPEIHRDRYRGPDFAKTEWEAPISIMRLSGDLFEDQNPILQAKTEHVRVLTYNGNKYFNVWFDPNNALTWRPDAFVGTQEGNYPDSVRSRISISGIWSNR